MALTIRRSHGCRCADTAKEMEASAHQLLRLMRFVSVRPMVRDLVDYSLLDLSSVSLNQEC